MDTIQDGIIGVVVKEVSPYLDQRGWLTEIWRSDEYKSIICPAMSYISMTNPETARGPHEHVHQTDCFVFLGNSRFYVKLWDNRKESSSFNKTMFFDCEPGKIMIVIVPPGVVHGYKNTGDKPGLIINLPDKLYAGEGKKEKIDEIRHEIDPQSQFRF